MLCSSMGHFDLSKRAEEGSAEMYSESSLMLRDRGLVDDSEAQVK